MKTASVIGKKRGNLLPLALIKSNTNFLGLIEWKN